LYFRFRLRPLDDARYFRHDHLSAFIPILAFIHAATPRAVFMSLRFSTPFTPFSTLLNVTLSFRFIFVYIIASFHYFFHIFIACLSAAIFFRLSTSLYFDFQRLHFILSTLI